MFQDVLDTLKGTGVRINIEIKSLEKEIFPPLLDLIVERDMLNQVIISSFNLFLRKYLSEECSKRGIKDIPFGYLTEEFANYPFETIEKEMKEGDYANFDAFALQAVPEFTEPALEKCRSLGLKLGIWFGMTQRAFDLESAEYYKQYRKLGVDTIITNLPAKSLAWRTEILNEDKSDL